MARFAFKSRLEQLPLFISVCTASTGKDLAAFVFNRLKTNNAPFAKLTSIATDGATNMIVQVNGMVGHFRRLVRRKCGAVPCSVNNIWCLAQGSILSSETSRMSTTSVRF